MSSIKKIKVKNGNSEETYDILPDQLQSLGAQYPEGNRTANRGGVYNYITNASVSVTSTPDGYATRPVQYSSVIGFGAGSSGSAEILAEWTGGVFNISSCAS